MKFKVFRDWLQQTIYKIINPIVHGMIKIGIHSQFYYDNRINPEYCGCLHIPLCRNERRTR